MSTQRHDELERLSIEARRVMRRCYREAERNDCPKRLVEALNDAGDALGDVSSLSYQESWRRHDAVLSA